MSLIHSTARELLSHLSSGETTSEELTRLYLDQIEQHDAAVGAFIRTLAPSALERVAEIDARRASGKPLGLLAGLPLAIGRCIVPRLPPRERSPIRTGVGQ